MQGSDEPHTEGRLFPTTVLIAMQAPKLGPRLWHSSPFESSDPQPALVSVRRHAATSRCPIHLDDDLCCSLVEGRPRPASARFRSAVGFVKVRPFVFGGAARNRPTSCSSFSRFWKRRPSCPGYRPMSSRAGWLDAFAGSDDQGVDGLTVQASADGRSYVVCGQGDVVTPSRSNSGRVTVVFLELSTADSGLMPSAPLVPTPL